MNDPSESTNGPRISKVRTKMIRSMCQGLLAVCLRLESKKVIYVRKFKIAVFWRSLKVSVSILDSGSDSARADKELAKERLVRCFAWYWGRFRLDKVIIECDLENGAVTMRAKDWGVLLPLEDPYARYDELLERSRMEAGQAGDMLTDGFLYDDFGTFADMLVKPEDRLKSLKEILTADTSFCERWGVDIAMLTKGA